MVCCAKQRNDYTVMQQLPVKPTSVKAPALQNFATGTIEAKENFKGASIHNILFLIITNNEQPTYI